MQTDPNSKQTVIFLHLPKTAGTTLQWIIGRQYPNDSICYVGPMSEEAYREFQSLSEAERGRFRLVRGHFAYGIHDYVPHPVSYFTILRNPIDRAVSYYYWIRGYERHSMHKFANGKDMNLKLFMESQVSYLTDNLQTRMLSGVWDECPIGGCTTDMLEQAKSNLRNHFDVVGLTEHFDETLLLLKDAYQWKNIWYRRQNVTNKRPPSRDLDGSTLNAVEEYNQLDLELYHYVQQLFKQQIELQGPGFANRLNTFQLLNRLFGQHLLRIWYGARRRLMPY